MRWGRSLLIWIPLSAAGWSAGWSAGCASGALGGAPGGPGGVATWETAVEADARAGAPTQAGAAVARPEGRRAPAAAGSPRTAAQPSPPGEALLLGQAEIVDVGLTIDRALAAFQSKRAVSRSLPRTSRAHGEAWEDVLEAIDKACQSPPTANDLGAFVRARVTLEVELDADLRRRILLPADLAARVKRTLAFVDGGVHELRMAAAPGTMQPVPRLRDGQLILRAPVAPLIVSSSFGIRWDPIDAVRRFHAGVDLSAPQGTAVYASAAGVVVYSGWQGGFGKHVVLDHGDGVRTHYSHMSELHVKLGQVVEEGDVLGGVGSTGRSTGPHLHFAVTSGDGRFHDPIKLLDVPLDAALGDVQPSVSASVGALSMGKSVDFEKVEVAPPRMQPVAPLPPPQPAKKRGKLRGKSRVARVE